MTSERMLPAMDPHHYNENHDKQYRIATTRYPTDTSNDEFELFVCIYDPDHHVNSRTWRSHISKCRKNHGGRTVICDFNAEHHVPEQEKEWHMMTCPDKHTITQDYVTSTRRIATQVKHNAWQAPESEENWDDEIEDDPSESFSLDGKKGMPIHLLPTIKNTQQQEEEYYDGEEAEEDYYGDKTEEGCTETREQKKSVLEQELLPEKPSNWESMSKTQRKNYKRNYNKQRQKMADEGVTEADFSPSSDPHNWPEERRVAKLNAIKARFPLAPEKQNATRFDYASLLNIVCQKCRISRPEFQECASSQGGFAWKCRVGLKWYQGWDFCSTKKDAKHECAKWALLGMEVPGIDNDVEVGPRLSMPVHPRMGKEDLQRMREADEVGKLMAANMYNTQKKGPAPLRQPRIAVQKSTNQHQQSIQQQQHFQQQNQQQQQQPQASQQQQLQKPRGWVQPSSTPLVNAVQNLNLGGNEDFPSLGGSTATNSWSTVTKKGGVKKVAGGRGGGRGRGRGTTMKLI